MDPTTDLAHIHARSRLRPYTQLRVRCDNGGGKLDFQDDVEWTLPQDWGACTLTVAAKRETTFSFVEFN